MAPRQRRLALVVAAVLAASVASPASAQDEPSGTACIASISPGVVLVGQQVLLDALRRGDAIELTTMFALYSGEVDFPACS